MTSEEGVVKATIFGGPKSKLRALAAPFHSGKLFIYHDPVKNSRKVSDFDVKSFRPGIREQLERSMTASAVADTILSSQGGGDSGEAALLTASLVFDFIDKADSLNCVYALIYFFWNWAEILGAKPDMSFCSSCQKIIPPEDDLWFSQVRSALLCENCINSSSIVKLGPGAKKWLNRAELNRLEELSRVRLDNASLNQAKAFTRAVMAGALGKSLAAWDW